LRKRYAVVGLLGVVSVITFLDRMAIAVVGPHIQQDLNISAEKWGWVLSAYVIAYGLFEIPSGALGDRFGQRRELTRITVWWSAFTALSGAVTSFVQLAVVRFCFGIGAAGAYPNAAGVLSRWLPARERARGQGMVWAASRLGGALAPLLLVPLELRFGWRAVFYVLAAVGAAWAIVWWLWFHDRPRDQPGITAAELQEIGDEHANEGHLPPPWRKLLRLKQLWLIVLAYGFYAWGSWFYFNWFPTWMVHAGGFSLSQMGVYASFPFFLGIASNLIGGVLCDRLGARIGIQKAYRIITFVCLTVTSILLAGMSFATSQVGVVALASVSFAAMDLMLPAAWAMCMSIGGRFGGVATGVMNTSGQVGGLFCTLAFGYMVSATGNYNIPVRAVALMVFVAAIIFSLIKCEDGLSDDRDELVVAPSAGA
jgi:ACS family glucarate transporter-like MFS transporter